MTVYLDVDRVVELHDLAAGPVPVIDRATLESAVARCQASYGGEDAFPRVVDKAAALLHCIASTQCFQDGNKRTAWLATVVFLELNGFELPDISDIEAEAFVMAVAVSAWSDRTVEKAAEWLELQVERSLREADATARTRHEGESIRVLDHVVLDDELNTWLDGHDFIDCEIVGPAVLILARDGVAFHSNVMEVAQFWELDPSRPYVGGVGLRNCSFRGCSFRDVGIAAHRQMLERFGA